MTTKLLRMVALCFLVLGFVVTPAMADDLSDARALIGGQLEMIKACFLVEDRNAMLEIR